MDIFPKKEKIHNTMAKYILLHRRIEGRLRASKVFATEIFLGLLCSC